MAYEMSPGPASPGPLWGTIFPGTDGATCQEHLPDALHCGSGKPLRSLWESQDYFATCMCVTKWGQQSFCGGLFLETRTWCICAAEMTGLPWSHWWLTFIPLHRPNCGWKNAGISAGHVPKFSSVLSHTVNYTSSQLPHIHFSSNLFWNLAVCKTLMTARGDVWVHKLTPFLPSVTLWSNRKIRQIRK